MKNTKTLFAMLILSGMFLISCGGETVTTTDVVDTTDSIELVETPVVDTVVTVDTAVVAN